VVYWIIAGGVFYIVGAVIYATAKREFVHALFHLFVLLGLASHIYAAWVIPL
jgi:hemolysin III